MICVTSSAGIHDRYWLAEVVEVTLRKMHRDEVPLPVSAALVPSRASRRISVRAADLQDLQPIAGLLFQLLSDYSI